MVIPVTERCDAEFEIIGRRVPIRCEGEPSTRHTHHGTARIGSKEVEVRWREQSDNSKGKKKR